MEKESVKSEASPEKQELLDLEKTGEYVFHGSGKDLNILEPRQAIDVKKGYDGAPAVFAANTADMAIFHAIINKENCPEGFLSNSGATVNDETELVALSFGATQNTLEQIKEDAVGYVYVFDKKYFIQRKTGGVEYVSHDFVKPILRVKVSKNDLPSNIEIIPENQDEQENNS